MEAILQRSRLLPLCILAGVGFLVYVNSLPNSFVWDDGSQIVQNTAIKSFSNLFELFKGSTFSGGGAEELTGSFYRPFVPISYLLNYHVFGLEAWGFRIFQIAFHLFNVILLFFLVEKVFSSRAVAFLAALFFAVHPANVESVAYIASIGEVLFTFFILLAFFAVLKRNMWGFFALTFLGLLAKETAVVILPIVLSYFFIFIKPKVSFYLKFVAGSFGILSLYFFLRMFVGEIPVEKFHLTLMGQASFFERVFTLPFEMFVYLKTLVYPLPLATYQNFLVQSVSDIRFWGSLLFLLLLVFLFIVFLKRQQGESRKLYVFSIGWFALGLAPVSNLALALDMTVAERWLYFPAIGFYVFLSLFIVQVARVLGGAKQKVLIVCVAGILLLFSARTIARNFDWRNNISLYGRDIQYSKNSFELENNYGKALYLAGETKEAELHFQKALALQPNSPHVHNNFGTMLFEEGNYEQAEAEFRKAIELGDLYPAYENVAVVLFERGKLGEAEIFITAALLKFPNNPKLNLILAVLYYNEGKSREEIIPFLSKKLKNDPTNEDAKKLQSLIGP